MLPPMGAVPIEVGWARPKTPALPYAVAAAGEKHEVQSVATGGRPTRDTDGVRAQVPSSKEVYTVELTVTDDGESGVNPGSCSKLGEAWAAPPAAASDRASSGTATAFAAAILAGLIRWGRFLPM